MKKFEEYILWLPSWYPNELEPYNGDFIQRHAVAASYYNEIYVLYIIKDSTGKITKSKKEIIKKSNRLTEVIIYYYSPFKGLLGKLYSDYKYRSIYKKSLKSYITKKGLPKIVHVHVAMKAGLIALWMLRRFNVPYILSEHWSGLLPNTKPSFRDLPFYLQVNYRKILVNALEISTVSEYLGESIKSSFYIRSYKIIPNVVDNSIFKPLLLNLSQEIKFIHISSLKFEKNPEMLLNALSILKYEKVKFNCLIVGPDSKEIKNMADTLGLNSIIQFENERPQSQLSDLINKSHALILCSRYETFGCVIIEANSCGVPVLVSDIPAMHEIVEEGVNGMFVEKDNPQSLALIIKKFISEKNKFSPFEIAAKTHEKYSYRVVGKKFDLWYRHLNNKNKSAKFNCKAFIMI